MTKGGNNAIIRGDGVETRVHAILPPKGSQVVGASEVQKVLMTLGNPTPEQSIRWGFALLC